FRPGARSEESWFSKPKILRPSGLPSANWCKAPLSHSESTKAQDDSSPAGRHKVCFYDIRLG
ncbi:MAG: hypothetical protein FWE92_06440, partial [Defluviitaleaceae bacterium]|nr:hypothetical protein [Defluviitaleaceae bacterium]